MRSALLLCAVLTLAACAGGRRHDIPADIRGQRARVFLSPSGEPFHGTPEQSSPLLVWFSAADVDHDGHLTAAEFEADAARFFTLADEDHNGLVTSPEVSDLRRRIAPELDAMAFGFTGTATDAPVGGEDGRPLPPDDGTRRIANPGGPGGGMIRRMRPMPPVSLLGEREPVLASDADFNRRVTPTEFAAAAADRFKRLDAQNLGFLTAPQLQTVLTERLEARR